jgi:hypothetical protein
LEYGQGKKIGKQNANGKQLGLLFHTIFVSSSKMDDDEDSVFNESMPLLASSSTSKTTTAFSLLDEVMENFKLGRFHLYLVSMAGAAIVAEAMVHASNILHFDNSPFF